MDLQKEKQKVEDNLMKAIQEYLIFSHECSLKIIGNNYGLLLSSNEMKKFLNDDRAVSTIRKDKGKTISIHKINFDDVIIIKKNGLSK